MTLCTKILLSYSTHPLLLRWTKNTNEMNNPCFSVINMLLFVIFCLTHLLEPHFQIWGACSSYYSRRKHITATFQIWYASRLLKYFHLGFSFWTSWKNSFEKFARTSLSNLTHRLQICFKVNNVGFIIRAPFMWIYFKIGFLDCVRRCSKHYIF